MERVLPSILPRKRTRISQISDGLQMEKKSKKIYEATNYYVPCTPPLMAEEHNGAGQTAVVHVQSGHPPESENRVKTACTSCKRSKTKCDRKRPCKRCVRRGRADSCVDSIHKKRGRSFRKHTWGDLPINENDRLLSSSRFVTQGKQETKLERADVLEGSSELQKTMFETRLLTRPVMNQKINPIAVDPTETLSKSEKLPMTQSSTNVPITYSHPPIGEIVEDNKVRSAPFAESTIPNSNPEIGNLFKSSNPFENGRIAPNSPMLTNEDTSLHIHNKGVVNSTRNDLMLPMQSKCIKLKTPAPNPPLTESDDQFTHPNSLLSLMKELKSHNSHVPVEQSKSQNLQGHSSTKKEEKKDIPYLELVLLSVNKSLERWKLRIQLNSRSVHSGDDTATEDSQGSPHMVPYYSKRAYEWIARGILKGMKRLVASSSTSSISRSSNKKNMTEAKEMLYGNLPIGVLVFTFGSFRSDSLFWVNQSLADNLGYMRSVLRRMLRSFDGISKLYDKSNIEDSIQLFMESVCNRRENYSTNTIWIHADGNRIRMLESVSIKYNKEGIPLNVTVFLQKNSGIKVTLSDDGDVKTQQLSTTIEDKVNAKNLSFKTEKRKT